MQQSKPVVPAAKVVAIVAILVVVATGAVVLGKVLGTSSVPTAGLSIRPSAGATASGLIGTPTGTASGPAASVGPVGTSTGPTQAPGTPGPTVTPGAQRFPGGLLIADRLNDRLIVVNDAGTILWRFPVAGSLPNGEGFSADDAFIAPDHKTIVANEEQNQVIVRIDIATRKVVWEYGEFGKPGSGPGQLWNPDDAYPLANGDITVADIKNCRVLEIAPDKSIVRQWGQTSVCADNPPRTYGQPNGDTPLPDGGILITEIYGARLVRLSATGKVLWDIHVPLHYPSDAQLLPDGNVLVVDYWRPGSLLVLDPTTGAVVYRYAPTTGKAMLNHPSLALPLPDGTFVLNDDRRHRVLVIDPTLNKIVWIYGHTGHASSADGYLNTPDGMDVAAPGTFN